MPTSAPENGDASLVSRIIAGTEPAPTKTSSAVPMNSAASFCARECSSMSATTSFRPRDRKSAGRSAGCRELSLLGTIFDITERRSSEHKPSRPRCQAHKLQRPSGARRGARGRQRSHRGRRRARVRSAEPARGGLNVPARTEAGDLLVRVAERDVPRGREPRRRRWRAGADRLAAAASRSRSSSSPPHERGQRAERAGEVGARREDRRLVLLEVAVVGERQALDGREQPGQAPDRSARPCRARARRRRGSASAASSTSPVAASSPSRAKPNSAVVQSTSSSPIRERWTKQTAAA